jgi:hypothetical protein
MQFERQIEQPNEQTPRSTPRDLAEVAALAPMRHASLLRQSSYDGTLILVTIEPSPASARG